MATKQLSSVQKTYSRTRSRKKTNRGKIRGDKPIFNDNTTAKIREIFSPVRIFSDPFESSSENKSDEEKEAVPRKKRCQHVVDKDKDKKKKAEVREPTLFEDMEDVMPKKRKRQQLQKSAKGKGIYDISNINKNVRDKNLVKSSKTTRAPDVRALPSSQERDVQLQSMNSEGKPTEETQESASTIVALECFTKATKKHPLQSMRKRADLKGVVPSNLSTPTAGCIRDKPACDSKAFTCKAVKLTPIATQCSPKKTPMVQLPKIDPLLSLLMHGPRKSSNPHANVSNLVRLDRRSSKGSKAGFLSISRISCSSGQEVSSLCETVKSSTGNKSVAQTESTRFTEDVTDDLMTEDLLESSASTETGTDSVGNSGAESRDNPYAMGTTTLLEGATADIMTEDSLSQKSSGCPEPEVLRDAKVNSDLTTKSVRGLHHDCQIREDNGMKKVPNKVVANLRKLDNICDQSDKPDFGCESPELVEVDTFESLPIFPVVKKMEPKMSSTVLPDKEASGVVMEDMSTIPGVGDSKDQEVDSGDDAEEFKIVSPQIQKRRKDVHQPKLTSTLLHSKVATDGVEDISTINREPGSLSLNDNSLEAMQNDVIQREKSSWKPINSTLLDKRTAQNIKDLGLPDLSEIESKLQQTQAEKTPPQAVKHISSVLSPKKSQTTQRLKKQGRLQPKNSTLLFPNQDERMPEIDSISCSVVMASSGDTQNGLQCDSNISLYNTNETSQAEGTRPNDKTKPSVPNKSVQFSLPEVIEPPQKRKVYTSTPSNSKQEETFSIGLSTISAEVSYLDGEMPPHPSTREVITDEAIASADECESHEGSKSQMNETELKAMKTRVDSYVMKSSKSQKSYCGNSPKPKKGRVSILSNPSCWVETYPDNIPPNHAQIMAWETPSEEQSYPTCCIETCEYPFDGQNSGSEKTYNEVMHVVCWDEIFH